jgi:hypothetical protein
LSFGGTGPIHGYATKTNQILKFAHSFLEEVNGGLIAGVGVILLLWMVILTVGQITLSQKFEYLLRLSKKSEWPIPIVFATLKISNLQATEKRKMPRFRVFRQLRYVHGISNNS